MLTGFVWLMAGTAMWHFSVLVPDRFYRGIIGALAAANVGAVMAGLITSGFVLSGNTGMGDAVIGCAGGGVGLVLSWLYGRRFDPVMLDELRARS